MLAALGTDTPALGLRLPLWSALPFVLTLGSLAVLPVVAPRFWHAHYPKVVLALASSFAVPFLAVFRGEGAHDLVHILLADYVPFLVILVGLYTTAGGLVVRGDVGGTPASNTALLALGTAIASAIGTTGASMVLIRPLLRANAHRVHREHIVVFFIFLVSNIGGCLTPLGDPPLFLGFLAGVPFFWTLRLAPPLLVLAAVLLPLFYAIDRTVLGREAPGPSAYAGTRERVRLDGKRNLVLLAAIVGAVALSGFWHPGTVAVLGAPLAIEGIVRDAIILLCAAASLAWTPRGHRLENSFAWGPVREVAILFAGVFVTILPVLAILETGPAGALAPVFPAAAEPWQYFWVTGILSSFLDNAPTYLTMFKAQVQRFHGDLSGAAAAAALSAQQARHLAAVAAASVFMGANTYIGNAPNFMVKAIAERAGVTMPSFSGYVLRWSMPILLPLFVLLTLVFFR